MGYVHERRAPLGERPLGRPMMGYSASSDPPQGARPPRDTGMILGPVGPPRSGYSATRALPESLTREQELERYCIRQAQREVDCWLLGTVFHPEPFRYQKPWLPTRSGVPCLETIRR